MFLEPKYYGRRRGWIEVITGCMFSGKTEELIRRLKRAQIARQKVGIFKPVKDQRYEIEAVVSHDKNSLESIVVEKSSDLSDHCEDLEVIGIDEGQFFDNDLPVVCESLALKGLRIIVAGLDLDYRALPFGPMPDLLAVAEYVTKVHAICPHCGNLANRSYRLTNEQETILVGEKDKYEPRCRACYSMGNILDFRSKNVPQ